MSCAANGTCACALVGFSTKLLFADLSFLPLLLPIEATGVRSAYLEMT